MSQEPPYLNRPKNTQRFTNLVSTPRRLLRSLVRSGSSFGKQWENQAEEISHYWKLYGGARALLGSPYVYISLCLTVVCVHFSSTKTTAAEIAVGVLPNLLGFTVGALAIVLAFSSGPVFETLAQKGKPESFFMKLTASLIHFILVQVLALTSAIVARMTEKATLDVITLFLLFYAVLVTFAAGLQLFLTALIYNAKASVGERKREPEQSED